MECHQGSRALFIPRYKAENNLVTKIDFEGSKKIEGLFREIIMSIFARIKFRITRIRN